MLVKTTATAQAVLIVLNEKGLHTRPSTELVKCASLFSSKIRLFYRNFEVNCKSLLEILMLAAGKGARIEIKAVGDDAEEAVDTILNLSRKKFNIKY